MTSKTRIKQIQKKLKMDNQSLPLTYWTMLFVDEDKSFEETLCYDRSQYSNSNNGFININRGKEFLEEKTLEELPKVKRKLKEIYEKERGELKKDPRVAAALVWVYFKEGVDI